MTTAQILAITGLALDLIDRLASLLDTINDKPIEIDDIGSDLRAARQRLQQAMQRIEGDRS